MITVRATIGDKPNSYLHDKKTSSTSYINKRLWADDWCWWAQLSYSPFITPWKQ